MHRRIDGGRLNKQECTSTVALACCFIALALALLRLQGRNCDKNLQLCRVQNAH